MKWETVKKVLDESGEMGLYACKFNFRGEPLLHKDIGQFIRYAKEKGVIDVFFNTNGVLLTEDKAKMLIESGLDRLTVSFEGFEKKLYEKNRIGAQFKEVVANVVRLRDIRERLGSRNPRIRIQAVLVPELKGRLDEFVSFWKDKVDQISYNEIEPSVDTINNDIKKIKSSWICPFPYQRMTVMWDGTLTACKNDYYGKLAMGNIDSVSIKKCWNDSLNTLRKLHKKGQAHDIEACGECPLRMSELIKRKEVGV